MRELYQKYRPKSLKQVIGQVTAVQTLAAMIRGDSIPHCILFAGSSGNGKTTLARILKTELECSDNDFQEINCADFRGIEMVRDIRNRMFQSPIGGDCRIWLIDECHMLSSPAQNAFLKMLEDTPSHVYFFLATTHPQKLLRTIRTRATEIKVKDMSDAAQNELLQYVLKKEKTELGSDVIESLIDHSEASARKILVLLHQIIGIKKEEDQLNAITSADSEAQGIAIARALINEQTTWKVIGKILREVDDDPEGLRWMVLSYANSVITKAGPLSGRAYQIIEAFRDNFYDSKKAGLSAACYEVIIGE